jgi:calcium/calmodulin-dependent protein kinase I
VRVADLGLAISTPNDELLYDKCGSPGYVAPEIFKKSGYSYKADIFSLGSVFFNLLTGCFLFGGLDADHIMQKNIECKTEAALNYINWTTPECRDLLS